MPAPATIALAQHSCARSVGGGSSIAMRDDIVLALAATTAIATTKERKRSAELGARGGVDT